MAREFTAKWVNSQWVVLNPVGETHKTYGAERNSEDRAKRDARSLNREMKKGD